MKRILLSAGTLVFVGVLAVSATGAFFNDTETSTGNTFAAGAIDLTVDSTAHYDGLTCTNGLWVEDQEDQSPRQNLIGQSCSGSWAMTDLGPTNTFFNLGDLKPGDQGENTISLHVENNDAYACAVVNNLQDNDNGLTEPESGVDSTGGDDQGELSQELHFFAWADNGGTEQSGGVAGDNIWNGDEQALFSNTEGPASDVLGGVSYPLFTPQTTAMSAGDTEYVGLYWCYGALTVNAGNHTLSCNGAPVTNLTQTDSMSADISFYVEQARNNSGFVCPDPGQITPDSNNTVVVNSNSTDWEFNGDRTGDAGWTLGTGAFVAGPAPTVLGTGSAQVTVDAGTDREKLRKLISAGIQVSDFSELKYSTYRASPDGGGALALALQFDVDMDGTPLDPSKADARIVYEPYYTHAIADDTWQTWDTMDNAGTGNWWIAGPGVGATCTMADPCTWTELNTNYPDMRTSAKSLENIDTQGAVMFKAGGGWASFDGNVDKFVWGVSGNSTTYNFEN